MCEEWLNNGLKYKIKINNFETDMERKIRCFFNTNSSFRNFCFMKSLPNLKTSQRIIKNNIVNKSSFASIRFGLYEYMLCYQYLEKKCGIRKKYSDFIRYHISMDAGIFNCDDNSLDKYSNYVISNLDIVDVISYWRDIPNNSVFRHFYNPNMQQINVDYLYPYPFLHKGELPNWQLLLRDKNVLVVSAFSKTIKQQYEKRNILWNNSDHILPSFNLITYEAIRTNAGQTDPRFKSWEEALNYMEEDILQYDFDIALISCGAYGMPLAMKLKKKECKAIQWGGCFQLWFGILGGRWNKDSRILKYVNSAWTYPLKEETPPLANLINNSCYWKPDEN